MRLAAALSALALVVHGEARADEELDALLEEPLVQSASKTREASSTAPAVTTSISADDLREYGIRTLDEAINFLSTGLSAETPRGAAEVGARGVLISQDYGAHLLLLIDGHAVNEPWGGSAYYERGAGIPFDLIDHIEIIVGPGSVLYGSNAMLGVINVVTKRARDHAGVHASFETELTPNDLGVGWSTRSSVGAGFEFDFFDDPGEVVIQAEYFTFEGQPIRAEQQLYGNDAVTGLPRVFSNESPPGTWGGVVDQSHFTRVPSVYAHLRLGDFDLRARGAMFDRGYPASGANFDDRDNYELDRWVNLDASYGRAVGKHATLRARLYGDLYDYQQFYPSAAPEDCLEGQSEGCLLYLLGGARWGGLEVNGAFDWMADGRFVTMIGVDGRAKNVFSRIDITPGEAEPEDRYDVRPVNTLDEVEFALGVYLQQTLAPTKWLSFNVGARLDLDDRYGLFASPRGAVVVSPWKGAAFKGIVANAFRGPTAFERYYADPTSQVEAPNLRPEVVKNIEGVFEQRFGAQRVEVGAFVSSYRDLVVNEDLTQAEIDAAVALGQLSAETEYAEQTRNAAEIEVYGLSARVEGSLASGALRYGASVTRARARRFDLGSDVGEELPVAASLFGNARVSYDLPDAWPTLAVIAHFKGERITDSEAADGSPQSASPYVEVRGTVSGPVPYLGGLRYAVSGGATFADAYPYGIGPATLPSGNRALMPVEPGRVAVGLSYSFVP